MSSRASKTRDRKRRVLLPPHYQDECRLGSKERARLDLAVKSYIFESHGLRDWVYTLAIDHFLGLSRYGKAMAGDLTPRSIDLAMDVVRNTPNISPTEQWDILCRVLPSRIREAKARGKK